MELDEFMVMKKGHVPAEEAIAMLDRLTNADIESSHRVADEILVKFLQTNGHADVASAWVRCCDRCSGFWYT